MISMRQLEFRNVARPKRPREAVEHEAPEEEPPPLGAKSDAVRGEQVLNLTVAEFVAQSFLPEHVAAKRTSGRRHYQAILKHILSPDFVDRIFGVDALGSKAKLQVNPNWPYIDNVGLRDIKPEHVRSLVSAALEVGYSTQTAKHIRNVLSAVISHAIKVCYFVGANPAISVPSPGMQRKEPHALTFVQTVGVLQAMHYPEFEITLIAILTGMSIAEICGLQWKYVNLMNHPVQREGEFIPPRSIAVRKQSYRGELSNVPAGRRKDILVPNLLRSVLLRLNSARSAGWNDFVLVSRTGSPINQINVAARRLKAIGEQLEVPWLSWQVVRRTRARLVHEFGNQLENELAMAVINRPDPRPAEIDRTRLR